jgi:glutathione S-transferase
VKRDLLLYQLYYYPNNASLAAHFLLHHMACDYELILVDRESNSHKSPAYLMLNPTGRIPTLIHDGQALFESAAICIHLCEENPQHNLIPTLGARERPLFFQWLAYLNNTLQAELMVRYYPLRHTTDEKGIPQIIAAQDKLIASALSVINDQLAHHDYLIGEQLTACDFFLFMLAEWALPIKQSPLTFVHLRKYLTRMSKLPTIQAVCKIEKLDLTVFDEIQPI